MREIKVNCDICGTLCEVGKDLATFTFLGFAASADKILQPVVRNEDYCSGCGDKIKSFIDDVKRTKK